MVFTWKTFPRFWQSVATTPNTPTELEPTGQRFLHGSGGLDEVPFNIDSRNWQLDSVRSTGDPAL